VGANRTAKAQSLANRPTYGPRRKNRLKSMTYNENETGTKKGKHTGQIT
tara:strand:- start:3492 stop:3638 length:147 start_codon:yes stop_codon:yes gene_type:complete